MTRTQKNVFSLLALSLIAGAAAASDELPLTWANEQAKPFVSTVTRAQVVADMQAARQGGELNAFDNLAYMQPKAAGAPLSPVMAELRDGVQRVTIAAKLANPEGSRSREEVRAELDAARRSGEMNPFDNLAYMQPQQNRIFVAPAALAHNGQ